MTVYGAEDDQHGTQVRDFHTSIKGEMPGPDGPVGRYHALAPETFYWAHATFVEQVLYFADTFVTRLSDADREQIYAESKTWYRRYGVSDRTMPADYAAFRRYWDDMLDRVVVAHPTARYGVGYVTKGVPRPSGVPPWVWRLVVPAAQPGGGLPDHRWPAPAGAHPAWPAVERGARSGGISGSPRPGVPGR